MAGYAHISRCIELSDDDISGALDERRASKALLDRLAKVARPADGAPKILVLLARLAGKEVDWIDGAVRVEVVADGEAVAIDVLSELGDDMQERVFPAFKMAAPFKEFARVIDHMPATLEPLVVVTKTAKRFVLAAAVDSARRRSSSPATVTIGDDSIYLEPEPAKIPSRSGKTLRPAPADMAAPAPKRKSTLRPDVHGVPPPIPSVMPRAPRLPRMDAEGTRGGKPERSKARGTKSGGEGA